MSYLSLITEIIKVLAWPCTVIVIVLMLRKPLIKLIPLLQRLKYKDLELDFGKSVKELREDAIKVLPDEMADATLVERIPEKIIRLAEISPRAAVMESWHAVQKAAIDALRKRRGDLEESARGSQYRLVQTVAKAGLLDEDQIGIYHNLRFLRNEAAHSPDFALSPESALEYSNLAYRLTEHFHKL